MARYRGRAERDARRMRVLADVAEIAHGGQPVEEIARAVVDVLVPRVVDLCAIDIIGPGGRLAAARRRGGRRAATTRESSWAARCPRRARRSIACRAPSTVPC